MECGHKERIKYEKSGRSILKKCRNRLQFKRIQRSKFKNGKTTAKDEIAGKMIKGGGDRVVEWI